MGTPLLLLDFGGVCLLNPVELYPQLEAQLGMPAGTLSWKGPVDPSTDELWRRVANGDGVTERDYWAIRAEQVGSMIDAPMSTAEFMNRLYEPPTPDMIRPGCTRTVAEARELGWSVAVFTNDLSAFHGPDWAASIPFLQEVDQVVDCSNGPALKPDPRAYEWALAELGVARSSIVFVDDQPMNAEGAVACGIETIWFDVAKADESWDRIAARIRSTG